MNDIQRQHSLALSSAILAGAALGKGSPSAGGAALEELLEQLVPPHLALAGCVCSAVGTEGHPGTHIPCALSLHPLARVSLQAPLIPSVHFSTAD